MHNRIPPVTNAPSGQHRINAKRNNRAAFWAAKRRTVRVRCSIEAEPYFREYLNLLDGPHGDLARIDSRENADDGFGLVVDLLVYIPGAPDQAVRANPIFEAVREGDQYMARLVGIDWYDGDWQRIDAERESIAGAAQ